MKRNANILLLSVLLVVAGCTMEEQYVDNDQNKNPEELITLRASRESDPETRTVRDESNGDVLWAPGDAISLFYGSGSNGGSKFTSNATENSKITNFTGTITAITGGGEITPEATYFWGVYPYNDDVSCDGTTVTMTLPTEQVAVPGTFAPNTFPSIGRSQGLIMGFYNICGGWRFSVTKEGVRKVTLKSNGGEKITGKVKVGFNDSGIPKIQEIIDGSDEVVIECPRGEYFEVGKNYYMIMLPTVFTSGFTMTFETYTEEGVYNRTAKTTISRSKFSGIANLDNYLTTPYTQKTGNIPIEDANFKAYLVENFDGNGDGEISYEEANAIKRVQVSTNNIQSVQGIEYMTNLEFLNCSGSGGPESGQLYNIDLTNNLKLKTLYCGSNSLSKLDVSHNTALQYLSCTYNQLTNLNLSYNKALGQLYCFNNQLISLDISNCTVLTSLSCTSNQLENLDLSNNHHLVYLTCNMNKIGELDLTSAKNLNRLICSGNLLTSLNVSNCSELTELNCYDNKLSSLDVSNNCKLTKLTCSSNQLTSLDISNNTELKELECMQNQLTSLDVSQNVSLLVLHCPFNNLSSLDLSNNTVLNSLGCFNNQLTSLDVSKNTELTYLDCSPMSSLVTLYIHQGQNIPSITVDRNVNYIPATTEIVVNPDNGGSEGTGDEELNP